jgi:signal transduction histidine kinase
MDLSLVTAVAVTDPAPSSGATSDAPDTHEAPSLARRLMEARAAERLQLACELHDGLAQFLMAAHNHFEAFRLAEQAGNRERAAEELEKGRKHLKQSVQETRRLINALRPAPEESGETQR